MTTPAGPVSVLAPAKLTLSLRVLGVRPDGYHELEAEMVSVDLFDELTFDDGDRLEIDAQQGVGPVDVGPSNLVRRALTAVGRRAAVRLVKRIPIGGGLGGGSADAAAVLRWAGCSDLAVAAGLGADVPFCVTGGRARVTGIGERVEPLAFEERSFVLVVPPLAVDTAAAYRAWDDLGDGGRRSGAGSNDLEAAALVVSPELTRWRDRIGALTGATPRLAGSGATWFLDGAAADHGLDAVRGIEMDGRVGRVIPVKTVRPR